MTLEIQREEAVQALCAHYAQDHLSTQELEARFERAYKASSRADLDTVLAGLPALRTSTPAPGPLYQVAPARGALPTGLKRYLGFFSSLKKEGAWSPAPRIQAKAILGEVVLDFREAALPPEGVEIETDVFMGEMRVLLPPGVGAEVDATAIMGEVTDKAQRALPGAPTVRVRGSALMGSIVVVTKLPKPARMESWRAQLKQLFGGDGSGSGWS